ncbi:HNH endonuclease [Streptomyces sp. NPDC006333]|uniref:HNH endonuclease n=1 Tax=Streptomyces sp. NPDC006333 TaxID=3156753 RepID=UPI0033A3F106
MEKRPPCVREATKLRYKNLDRDKRTCQDCGRTPAEGASLQIHHVLPVHKSGENDEENLITLCIQGHGGGTPSWAAPRRTSCSTRSTRRTCVMSSTPHGPSSRKRLAQHWVVSGHRYARRALHCKVWSLGPPP